MKVDYGYTIGSDFNNVDCYPQIELKVYRNRFIVFEQIIFRGRFDIAEEALEKLYQIFGSLNIKTFVKESEVNDE